MMKKGIKMQDDYDFSYIVNYYGVPACKGRGVKYKGELGVIVKPISQYVGVNLDKDKYDVILPIHPKDPNLEYIEMRPLKKLTRGQKTYQRYLAESECFESFKEFLMCEQYEKLKRKGYYTEDND